MHMWPVGSIISVRQTEEATQDGFFPRGTVLHRDGEFERVVLVAHKRAPSGLPAQTRVKVEGQALVKLKERLRLRWPGID